MKLMFCALVAWGLIIVVNALAKPLRESGGVGELPFQRARRNGYKPLPLPAAPAPDYR